MPRHSGHLSGLTSSSITSATRALIFVASLAAVSVYAHPEIDDALARLNTLIAASPKDADLYLERGELYVRHEDWVSAEANYLRAAELAPQHPGLPRVLGALEFAQGRLADARKHFDAAIARNPADAESLVLRARTLSALNVRPAAIADYDRALKLLENPPPEIFLERAALHASPKDALRGLDEGLARLGPIISLQLRALTIEEAAGLVDAALKRVDAIAKQTERPEVWLKRRGDILARAGRTREADAAYAAARTAIDALPDWLRDSPDTRRLATELTRLTSSRP